MKFEDAREKKGADVMFNRNLKGLFRAEEQHLSTVTDGKKKRDNGCSPKTTVDDGSPRPSLLAMVAGGGRCSVCNEFFSTDARLQEHMKQELAPMLSFGDNERDEKRNSRGYPALKVLLGNSRKSNAASIKRKSSQGSNNNRFSKAMPLQVPTLSGKSPVEGSHKRKRAKPAEKASFNHYDDSTVLYADDTEGGGRRRGRGRAKDMTKWETAGSMSLGFGGDVE